MWLASIMPLGCGKLLAPGFGQRTKAHRGLARPTTIDESSIIFSLVFHKRVLHYHAM